MPPPLGQNGPISLAGTEIQRALGLIFQAQNLGSEVAEAHVSQALKAVESVPGIIREADARQIRVLLHVGTAQEALRILAPYRNHLEAAQEQCRRASQPNALTAESLPFSEIAQILGLPESDFEERPGVPRWLARVASEAEPLIPAEARLIEINFSRNDIRPRELTPGNRCLELILKREEVKIQFQNGQYFFRNLSSVYEGLHNGRKVGLFRCVPIEDGDQIQVGRRESLIVRLPYLLRLKPLEEGLKQASAIAQVFQVLEATGFGFIVPKIRGIVSSPEPVDERLMRLRRFVPCDAGLLFKIEALMLQRELVHLRTLYFPEMDLSDTLAAGIRLTQSLARARSFRELAECLRGVSEEGFQEWIDKIEAGAHSKDYPKIFGLQAQVERLFWEMLVPDQGQRQDLQQRGVAPELLLERPWRRIAVSPLLEEALEPFRGAIGDRLNLDLDRMEESIRSSFGIEQDEPSQAKFDDDHGAVTAGILYDRYQAKNPTPSQRTGSAMGSSRPDFFGGILERLAKEGTNIWPKGYWFFGGDSSPQERFEGRIYLSLRRRHAESVFRYLNDVLEPAIGDKGRAIQYKIAGNPEGYARSDSGVIYFRAKDQQAVWQAVREMNRSYPEFFKEGYPRFTIPLKDEMGRVLTGLSFGEHPKNSGESFGSLRTDAMTTAIRTARALAKSAEPPDWEEICRMCAYFLDRAGVDIENPAFNKISLFRT